MEAVLPVRELLLLKHALVSQRGSLRDCEGERRRAFQCGLWSVHFN